MLTIHWKVIGLIGTIAILLILILVVFSLIIYKRIITYYKNKNFEKSISYSKKYRFLLLSIIGQYVHLVNSYIYLSRNELIEFMKCLSKINNKKLQAIKFYWLCLISLKFNDSMQFDKYFNNFSASHKNVAKGYSNEKMEYMLLCIFGVLNNKENAKKKLKENLAGITNFEKEICNFVLEKNELMKKS